MTFDQIETFVWLARLKSFRLAAEHLNLTQPAVSSRISNLEHTLGVQLFQRSSKGISLTDIGRRLLTFAEEMYDLSGQFRQLASDSHAQHGMLRIGATSNVTTAWLVDLLNDIKEKHRGLEFVLTVDLSYSLGNMLENGELDVAIIAGPLIRPTIAYQSIANVELCWACSDRADYYEDPITPNSLRRASILTDREGSAVRNVSDEWFRSGNIKPRLIHTCSGIDVRLFLASRGLGVCVAPVSAARRFREKAPIRILSSRPRLRSLEYGIAYTMGNRELVVRQLIETICGRMAEQINRWAYIYDYE